METGDTKERCQLYKVSRGMHWHVRDIFARMINDYLNELTIVKLKLLEWVIGELVMVMGCGK
jgi:hypothetical protein